MPRSKLPRELTAVDLFSGCGGLTTGLKKAGFDVLSAVETDPLACETYARNHRGVQLFRQDIRSIDPIEILDETGHQKEELDLLTGCPPCQGFSRLRTLNGAKVVDDPRNELVFEFARFARVLRPRAIMFENVPGLEKGPLWDSLIRRLRRAGYRCRWRISDASDFRVPQRRRRLILLGGLGQHIDFPEISKRRRTVRHAIGRLATPGETGDSAHDLTERRSPKVQALIARIPRDGGSMGDLGKEALLECHRRCRGFHDVYGRLSWDSVGPTITGGCVNPSKGRFLHPEENRCITIREAALLQSFPKRYWISLRRGKFPAAEMIGNAFPPEFAKHHAAAVARALLADSD